MQSREIHSHLVRWCSSCKQVIAFNKSKLNFYAGLTVEGKLLNDHLDIQYHDKAVETLFEFQSLQRALEPSIIQELHQLCFPPDPEVRAPHIIWHFHVGSTCQWQSQSIPYVANLTPNANSHHSRNP